MPAEELNEAILQSIESHVLTEETIELVISLTERDDTKERHRLLERERKQVAKQIANLTAAVEAGGDIRALADRLRERETRVRAIDQEVRDLAPVPRLPARVVENRLAEWRRLLRGSVTQARAVLQRVLRGRIVFTPCGDGYSFEAATRFDKLFAGVVVPRPSFVPIGRDPHEYPTAADTWDPDYEALLERAAAQYADSGKRGMTRAGIEPAAL